MALIQDLVNKYSKMLQPAQQGLSNIGRGIQQGAQNVGNFVSQDIQRAPIVQGLSNIQRAAPQIQGLIQSNPNAQHLNLYKDLQSGYLKSGIKPLDTAGQLAGSYVQNKMVQPLTNVFSGTSQALNSKNTLQQRGGGLLSAGLGGLQTAGNLIPEGQLLNAGIALSDSMKARQYSKLHGGNAKDQTSAADQGFVGNKTVGLGDALTKNKYLAMLGNGVEFAAPLLHGGVSSLKGSADAAALRDVSPNAFNIHPEDEKLLNNYMDRILNKGEKLQGPELKDLQNLAEHYLGEKFRAQTNQKIAQAFEHVLALKNGGFGTKLPIPSLVDGKENVANAGLSDIANRNLRNRTEPVPDQIGQEILNQSGGTSVAGNEASSAQLQSGSQGKPGIKTTPPLQSPPPLSGNAPSGPIIPQGKERGLITSTQEAPNITGDTKPLVQGTYIPKPNKQLMGEAKGLLEQGTNLDLKGVPNVDQKVAATIQEAVTQDGAGNHEAAANLINNLAKQGTELGRGVQAFSLLNKLSPEAYTLSAAKQIQEYNRTARVKIPELNAAQQEFISNSVKQIKTLPEGSREQGIAIQKLNDQISKYIPSSATNKMLALWRTGLLTGPQTVSKIAVSHGAMSVLEGAKNIPAAMVDKVISLITGNRSMSLTARGEIGGTKNGIVAGVDNLLHGYNDPMSGGVAQDFRNKVNFGDSLLGKVAQAYVDKVGAIHGSLYKPFYGGAHMNSLYDQALTEAGNKGLSGAEKNNFVINFVKNPPSDALKVAQRDAEMATFQQKTQLGQMASAVQQKGGIIGKVVVPFTKIPSAILTDVLNYSPAGAVKSVVEAINRGQFTQDSQRQLVQGLGRAATGTGILYVGAQLYKNGMIALDKPTTPKEKAQWELEGKKPQSVLIDGQWKNLGSLGPLGHALAIGGYFQKGMQDVNDPGVGNALSTTAAGVGKTTLDQSYLMGMQNLTSAIQDPAKNGKYEVQSLASSVIPTGVGTIARATDPLQRETTDPNLPTAVGNALKNKIPGLRETLLPKTDALGNTQQRSGSVLQNIIDPFASTTDTSGQATNNPVVSELGRLNDAGYAATPTKLTANQTINGVKQKLTQQQLNTLNQAEGPQIQKALSTLINSPDYKNLSDPEKQNAVNSVITQVRKQVRGSINMDTGISSSSNSTGQQYTLITDKGNVKNIDLSKPINPPQLTGSTELDKKLISQYNGEITSRANDIVALYKAGKIDVNTAETQLESLKASKASTGTRTGRAKGSKKIKIASIKMPRVRALKTPKIKVSKVKQYNLAKIKATGLKRVSRIS